MHCLYAAGTRCCLNDAGFGMYLHQAYQHGDALACHHAVGIQYHHVAIIFSPATAEISDVARLAPGATLAQTVIQAATIPHLMLQSVKSLQFLLLHQRIVSIREHVDIEEGGGFALGQRFAGRA
ncbi:hypothetical protein GALL_406690 [mine drainage metagenome]|uniref:Uncharacterized protein n=1 Tax=mine drainage metagenome TaxID=410659 RepID=A0A1J5Q1P5_9ZZZZ